MPRRSRTAMKETKEMGKFEPLNDIELMLLYDLA